MPFNIIPVDNYNPAKSFNCVLAGSTYVFDFRFNSRMQIWVFDLQDGNGNVIKNGIPFLSYVDCLKYVSSVYKPVGVLVPMNPTTGLDATRFDIGIDVEFIHGYDDV